VTYGKNEGWFRETRASRFDPNMGAQAAPVKSTDVESARKAIGLVSYKL